MEMGSGQNGNQKAGPKANHPASNQSSEPSGAAIKKAVVNENDKKVRKRAYVEPTMPRVSGMD